MEKIRNLDDMYKLMETINFSNYSIIKDRINSFLKDVCDEKTEKAIKCEHTCLDFRILDANINGIYTIENNGWKMVTIPNLDNLSEEDFKYIENRMNSVNNKFLKFRYSAILCNKYPHQNKAIICSDSSFELINDVENEIIKNKEIDIISYVTTIINSYRFSFKFNYNKPRIKNKIIEIINNKNYWNIKLYLIPYNLIHHILDEKKNFKEVTNLNAICWNIYTNIRSINPYKCINILELGEKTDKNAQYNWRLEIAKMYYCLMNQKDINAYVKAHYCNLAIENYKKAGENSEAEALLNQYKKFSADFQYSKLSFKIEIEGEILNYADSIVENHSSYEILQYLMNNLELSMLHKKSLDFGEKSKSDFPLWYASSKSLHDKNGFVNKKIVSDEEKYNYAVMRCYSLNISWILPLLFSQIINTAYIKGKLSPKIVLQFLKEETWLGLNEIPNVGENLYFRMIVPIINNYFHELELIYLYNIQQPNFILFIDSLILKIEGMLKLVYSIDNFIKEPTGDGAIQDKSLNQLLSETSDLISEDNLFFLKYLLIDKSGLNLRNKVAHSLMEKSDYCMNNASLLFLALLKICAFNLKNE